MELLEKHAVLFGGVSVSVILFFLFMFIKERKPVFLTLETRWIAISMVPLIFALFSGDYIYKFKGFGFEIETSLNKLELSDIGLTAEEAMTTTNGQKKGSVALLRDITESDKKNVKRISFVEGYKYYSANAIKSYVKAFKNLWYIEIVDIDNKFIGFMKAAVIKNKENDFVKALKDRNVLAEYSSYMITDFVYKDENIINVLKKINENSKVRSLAVIDNQSKMIGVLSANMVLRKISTEIVDAQKNN